MSIKVGIFGGSFNPIHNGHLAIAKKLIEKKILDEVWFMVSPQNPLKAHKDLADGKLRLKMVDAAVKHVKGMKVSDFEFHLPIPSYMYVTLEHLRETYPENIFSLIIGADNWVNFNKWVKPEEIKNHHNIIIYPRNGYNIKLPLPEKVFLLDMPLIAISSTLIRKRIKQHKNIKRYIDNNVFAIIKTEKLYNDIEK